ncbi:MAG: single-stranded DNA-binding protein [Spirochaetaceae bacterium]|nr:single-stranded DNA-binding protein [Spirochaetia bacterium]MCF7952347.1 single-stranded DNA-binding protein [Spirochaetaceae bacterium]
MNNLNSIIVEGNLTRDPEYRLTPKGKPVCMLSVASNRYYKKDEETKEETSFFNVETWAKLADNCNQYLTKGRGVRVVGRLKQDRWTNAEGQNRERLKIVAEHIDFKPQYKKNRLEGEEQEVPAIESSQEDDQELLEAV